MNDYWLYLFRIGYDRLYTRVHLRMSLDAGGHPSAVLTLFDPDESAHSNRCPIDLRFTGTPYCSAHDKTVYIIMRDQNEKLGILAFQYQKFNFGAMYFRSGLFLSTTSDTNLPGVQKSCHLRMHAECG